MGKRNQLLTRLELLVMRMLWQASPEPLTIRAVVDLLNRGRRPPFAYTTIQTIMMILKKKGVVKSTPSTGKAHLYGPRISRDEATKSLIGEFVDRLFEGRAVPLLTHLIEQKSVDRRDLEDLRRLIDTQLGDDEVAGR